MTLLSRQHVVYIGESPEAFRPEVSLPPNPLAGSHSKTEERATAGCHLDPWSHRRRWHERRRVAGRRLTALTLEVRPVSQASWFDEAWEASLSFIKGECHGPAAILLDVALGMVPVVGLVPGGGDALKRALCAIRMRSTRWKSKNPTSCK